MNHQQNKRLTVVMAVAVALFTMAGAADARKGGTAGNGLSSHQSLQVVKRSLKAQKRSRHFS